MGFYIYLIHNIINNKVYVGKAKDPHKRWYKHIKVARGNREKEKFYIHRAISKYGINNFIFSIIQPTFNENEANIAETYWIKFYQSNDSKYGYNQTNGGEGVSGRIVSEVTRQKQREKAIGRKHSKETKELLRIINIGKMPTNLEQLKTINIGKELTNEHRQKISAARQGIIFTEEHKNNISKSLTGLFVGSDNPFYGKSHTEEVKEKSRGENNKQAKLTSNNVAEIRIKYNSGNYTQQQLANEYHISRRGVGHIVNYTTWKHIKEK